MVLLLDEIERAIKEAGVELDRTKIRNGIHYAVRKGFIEKAGATTRGAWRLRNAEAPGSAGASETGESASDSPLLEGGTHGIGSSESDGDPVRDAQDHRALSLSASMSGGN